MSCKRHRWHRPESLGGCRENPGVWSIGGAAIRIVEECARCGVRRGCVVGDVNKPTRNHGWRIVEREEDA